MMGLEVNVKRADKLMELKRYQDAIKEYTIAIDAKWDLVYCYQQIGSCYLRLENHEQTLLYAKKSLEEDPLNHFAFYLLAKAKGNMGFGEEARADIQKAIQINPTIAFYYGSLAWSYMGDSDWHTAIKYTKEGLAINSEDTSCLMYLFLAYSNLKNHGKQFSEAAAMALKLKPNEAYVHLNLGYAYRNLEIYNKAKIHLKLALKLNPSLVAAKNKLDEIEAIKKSERVSIDYWKWVRIIAIVSIITMGIIGILLN